jgi:hypothetical protein
MDDLYHLTLKALIEKDGKTETEGLFKYLPENTQNSLKSLKEPVFIPWSLINEDEIYSSIHYSWFKPLIGKYKEQDKPYFINSFPRKYAESLNEIMGNAFPKFELPLQARQFFLHTLLKDFLKENQMVAKETLPKSSLNELLNLTKSSMILLVDLLGVLDLSVDLRKTLDKKVLDEIANSLTATQKNYLFSLIKTPNVPEIKPEDISFWQKNLPRIPFIIHQKGLFRLAATLNNESESLIWYICHKLDTGRSQEIYKYLKSLPNLSIKQSMDIKSYTLKLLKAIKEGKK